MNLPEDYYLHHFETLLEDVEERYGALLRPEEGSRVVTFRRLPQGARRLLVRMLLRRGPWFPEKTLHYTEIGEPGPCLEQLIEGGFCLGPEAATLEVLLPLATRQDLADLLTALGVPFPRSARRSTLEELLRPREEAPGLLRQSLRPARVAREDLWHLLVFLFFGNFEQDLSQFVVADLGHLRYADYALDPGARVFQTREEVDFLLSIRELREELARHPADLARITGAALAMEPHPGVRQQRRYQGLLNELGREWERLGEWTQALACFALGHRPPARERTARILAGQGDVAGACALALTMAEAPRDMGESRFARVFLHRHRKGMEGASHWLETHPAPEPPPERPMTLARPPRSVEQAVLEAAQAEGWEGFFAENHLWKALFGLVFWDELFAPIPGAFQHRFQNAPLDLRDFLPPRRSRVEARLAEIGDREALVSRVLGNADRHWGEACAFLHWKHLDRNHLAAALRRIPPEVVVQVLGTLAENPLAFGSGFPDLFLYRPLEATWALWEVKGPGDTLRPEQAWWLDRFRGLGCEVRVVRVKWGATAGPPSGPPR